jgi:beta-lactam-binding protein with PASTA domain
VILRERLHWMFRLALLLFVLSSVAFLSALTAMRFAIQGRDVAMPDVVGKSAVQAQQILEGRRLGIRVEDRIYSSLPVGAVVRQSPPPNTSVKIGQYAHVVLSLGPQKATIPQLVGASLRAAQIELLRGGMQLGEVSNAHLPGGAGANVIQQDPAPGTSDVTSPHVNLLVSLGPPAAAYVMPDLTGIPQGEAESKLTAAGLKIAKTTPVTGSPEQRGEVIGQTPAAGQRVDAGTIIQLEIAEQ